MEKSPEAFRTISEVAEYLETPAHVLRFWESRFPQIRPVKRAGGRRYYRPGDVALLSGIKRLLHDEGMTIRGVQKILREQGIRYVAGLSPSEAGAMPDEDAEATLAAEFARTAALPEEPAVAQTAQIISLERALARQDEAARGAAQAELWPADPGEAAAPAGPQWPEDPEDVTEAPFTEAEPEEAVDQVVALPPAPADPSPATAGESAAPEPVEAEGESAATSEHDSDSGPAEADDAAVAGDEATPAALLRRLRYRPLPCSQADLRAVAARLLDLRERLAQASRRRAR